MANYCITLSCLSHVKFSDGGKKRFNEVNAKEYREFFDNIEAYEDSLVISSDKNFTYKWGNKKIKTVEVHDDGAFIECIANTNYLSSIKEEFQSNISDHSIPIPQLISMEFQVLDSHILNVLLVFESEKPIDLISFAKYRGIISKKIRNNIHELVDENGFLYNLKDVNIKDVKIKNKTSHKWNEIIFGILNIFDEAIKGKKNQKYVFDKDTEFKLGIPNFIYDDIKEDCDNYRYEINLVLKPDEFKTITDHFSNKSTTDGIEFLIKGITQESPFYSFLGNDIYYCQDELLIWKLSENNSQKKLTSEDFFELFKGEYLVIAERLVYCLAANVYLRLIEHINERPSNDPYPSKEFRRITAYYESFLGRIYLQRGLIEGWHVGYAKKYNRIDPNNENREMFRNLQRSTSQIVDRIDSENAENSRSMMQLVVFFLTSFTLLTVYTQVMTFFENPVIDGFRVDWNNFLPHIFLQAVDEKTFILILALTIIVFISWLNRKTIVKFVPKKFIGLFKWVKEPHRSRSIK